MDIKICGLKTKEALDAALEGGASHVGFIFFPKSPRFIDPTAAGALREVARGKAKAVAVIVDADDETLDAIVAGMVPDLLQFHGRESPERLAELKARYGLPVIKALPIREAGDLATIRSFLGVADRFLFDAKPPKGAELPGGNGVSFDWSLLAGLDPSIDYLLSGGLNADNIGDALSLLQPGGIDVSSGVESAPGVKDVKLIVDFFRSVRMAQRERAA
ncbi:MAG TPA: phosphoribosylanthranilate isomerase [Rhizobiaceae bacterium]|nr:phosphoribosylanthranilate isomerase [Rhizobiaceae bacterium]